MQSLLALSAVLDEEDLDGWLIADSAGANPVFQHVIGRNAHLTRRAFILATRDEVRMLASELDRPAVEGIGLDCGIDYYIDTSVVQGWLNERLSRLRTVAMEYSPGAAIPSLSRVDAGTVEQVRATAVEVVSSGALVQRACARWTAAHLASHKEAMSVAVAAMETAYGLVQDALRSGSRCTESDVQRHIMGVFDQEGMVTDAPPIVAVNAGSGNPHYEPGTEGDVVLARGDWLLIDLWCQRPTADGVFADITWVGQVGGPVSERRMAAFDVVAAARDRVVEAASLAHRGGHPLRGAQLDRVAREAISARGYAESFVHRTGHSLSAGSSVHGIGANLDDFETHDDRVILPSSGFTVEPGVYFEDFGVRSEINVWLGPDGPVVTSPVQGTPLVLDV
jgi:Xaa-Pro dipeptidase